MADTAEQVRRVVARLRARGFTVEEIPGWETRGKGPMTTLARLEHHTAGARTGDAPSLRVVTFGRPGLRNSLSRWHVARTSGIIRLIALGVSWHAGKGIHGTNTTLSGTEAENTGTGEPWTQASLDAQAAISQEEAREFGFSTDRVFDHREHAPDRKIDRHGIDPTTWRQRLRRTPIIEEDDMAALGPPQQVVEARDPLAPDGPTHMWLIVRWPSPSYRRLSPRAARVLVDQAARHQDHPWINPEVRDGRDGRPGWDHRWFVGDRLPDLP